jgi:hypothetical protein
VGGLVEATDEGTVSVALVLITRGATVSDVDIPEVVRTMVCEVVG